MFPGVGKIHQVVLFRFQRQKQASARPVTLPGPCLLAHLTVAASKSGDPYDQKGSGSWNFLSPGDLASPAGSGKSCDSHDEPNSIAKVYPELHFCTQTDDIHLRPGIINGSPQNSNLKSRPWGGRTARDPSQLGLQIAVPWDFPAAVWIWK